MRAADLPDKQPAGTCSCSGGAQPGALSRSTGTGLTGGARRWGVSSALSLMSSASHAAPGAVSSSVKTVERLSFQIISGRLTGSCVER